MKGRFIHLLAPARGPTPGPRERWTSEASLGRSAAGATGPWSPNPLPTPALPMSVGRAHSAPLRPSSLHPVVAGLWAVAVVSSSAGAGGGQAIRTSPELRRVSWLRWKPGRRMGVVQWGEVAGSAHFRRYRSLGCMCPPLVSSCLCQSHQAQRPQLTPRRGSVTVGLVVKPRALAPTSYVVPVHL